MNYKLNEQGEVAIKDVKGNLKYVNKRLAEDKQLMKSMHFEIVEMPEPFIVEEKCDNFPEEKGGIKSATLIDEKGNEFELEIKTEVAETTPAKRGRKPNQ